MFIINHVIKLDCINKTPNNKIDKVRIWREGGIMHARAPTQDFSPIRTIHFFGRICNMSAGGM